MSRCCFSVAMVFLAMLCPVVLLGAPPKPSYLTKYDVMTDTDAFYLRYLDPDPLLDRVDHWPIVRHIVALGGRIVDSGIIADRLNRGLPVDEQPAFRHVKQWSMSAQRHWP